MNQTIEIEITGAPPVNAEASVRTPRYSNIAEGEAFHVRVIGLPIDSEFISSVPGLSSGHERMHHVGRYGVAHLDLVADGGAGDFTLNLHAVADDPSGSHDPEHRLGPILASESFHVEPARVDEGDQDYLFMLGRVLYHGTTD